MYTDPNAPQLKDCQPLITGPGGKVLHPCGLIAGSYFNDTFTLSAAAPPPPPSGGGGGGGGGAASFLTMSEQGIAWKSDVSGDKYEDIPLSQQAQYPSVTFLTNGHIFPNLTSLRDEHFMVWMRPASLPSFRKLYGKLQGAPQGAAGLPADHALIPAGTQLNFTISSNYPVSSFSGEKWLVVSTVSSALGGRNPVIPIGFIAVGALYLILGLLLLLCLACCGRRPGSTELLAWKKGS